MIEIINNVQNGIVELKFGDLGPSLFLVEKVSRRGRGGRTLGIKSAVAVIERAEIENFDQGSSGDLVPLPPPPHTYRNSRKP